MRAWGIGLPAECIGSVLAITMMAGCPGDSGCEAPFADEDFCGACNGTCYYCPIGTCIDPCDLDAGFNCLALKPNAPGAPARKAKPAVLSVSRDPQGDYQLTVDSGLNMPADVTWFSHLEGQVGSTGSIGSLCLNRPGVHVLTYSATPGGSGERIMSEPITVELW